MTLGAALERWLRVWGRGVGPKTKALVALWAEGWCRLWGEGTELTRIKPGAVEDLYLKRNDGVRSASALNTEKIYLGKFMLWCARHEYRHGDPTDVWPTLKEVVKREYVFLSREEEDRLVGAAREPWLKRLIVVGVCTGLRQGTLRVVKRGWLSDDGWLTVPAGAVKQREPYRILMAPRAVCALDPLPKEPEALLLWLPRVEYVWKRFKVAVRRAGISPSTSPHDLRRTFCKRLAGAGVSTERIKSLGGWRSSEVFVRHYFWPMDEAEARKVVEAL